MTSHTLTVAASIPSLSATLAVKTGSVTLDEMWSPYVRATLVCAMPSQTVIDGINPDLFTRASITLTSTSGPTSTRTFNLVVRALTTDYLSGEMTLELGSDESILQDLGRVSVRPDSTAQDTFITLYDIILARLATLPAGYTAPPTVPSVQFTFPLTNMVPNGGMEGTFGLAGTNVTVTRVAAPIAGTQLQLSAPTTTDGYATIDGDLGALRNGMQAGKTYTTAALLRITTVLGGSAAVRARRLVVIIQNMDGSFTEVLSPVAPNAVGAYRLAVSFTIPPGSIGAVVRYYHGHSAGTLFWDEATLVEGDRDPYFFDGNSSASSYYSYRWLGTTNASASVRIPKNNPVSFEALLQLPGQSHWDFLEALVSSLNLRLWCDEQRRWYVTAITDQAAGSFTIASADNLTSGGEEKNALSEDTFGAVVIRYEWTDSSGLTRTQYEAAGDPLKKVKLVNLNVAPTGTGLAARLLAVATSRRRTYPVTAISDYRLTPTQSITLTPPQGVSASAKLSAVTWRLPDGEMDVTLRDVIS